MSRAPLPTVPAARCGGRNPLPKGEGMRTLLLTAALSCLVLAAGCLLMAARSYEADKARANEMPVATEPSAAKAFA